MPEITFQQPEQNEQKALAESLSFCYSKDAASSSDCDISYIGSELQKTFLGRPQIRQSLLPENNLQTQGKREIFILEAKANRTFKDTVFTDLFYVYDKADENLLSLYNALYGTDYTDPSIIRKIRLENVLFMNFKNDVAFSVKNRRVVINEHQSTINPNLPLRKLMYVAREYEAIVDVRDRYRSRLVKIPTPEFITFYNGAEDAPEEQILRLSDAFKEKDPEPMLELKVRVLNINPGYNEELKDKCPVLREYTEFVERTRKFGSDKNALKKAVKECIKDGILSDYLRERGSEVINMLMAEYDYQTDIEVHREDAHAEGRAEGHTEGARDKEKAQVRKKLAKGKSLEVIADELEEEDLSVIQTLIDEINKEGSSNG